MISKAEIEHLKDLARVEFNKKETEKLAKDLGEILGYVDELKSVDVSSAPEMTHALEGAKNVFRKDKVESHPLTPSLRVREGEGGRVNDLVDAFPEKENNYLKVKAIL